MQVPPESARITELLHRIRGGDPDAEEQLAPLVYNELRQLARYFMRRERPDHTLQVTGLVNEAYIRLMGKTEIGWEDRSQFFSVAAGVMRRILVDYARARKSAKRGGGVPAIALGDGGGPAFRESWDKILDVHRALSRLADADERAARVVELRFFAGLDTREIAILLGLSERTVKRDWEFARSWLFAEIAETSEKSNVEAIMSHRTPKSRL